MEFKLIEPEEVRKTHTDCFFLIDRLQFLFTHMRIWAISGNVPVGGTLNPLNSYSLIHYSISKSEQPISVYSLEVLDISFSFLKSNLNPAPISKKIGDFFSFLLLLILFRCDKRGRVDSGQQKCQSP